MPVLYDNVPGKSYRVLGSIYCTILSISGSIFKIPIENLARLTPLQYDIHSSFAVDHVDLYW